MATLTLNVPDQSMQHLLDVLCTFGNWSEATGLTQLEFVETNIARIVAERVNAIEVHNAQVAALAAIVPPVIIDITR